MVSMHVFALAALSAASLAGRVGEDGTGAMWIAAELVQSAAPITSNCNQPLRIQNVDLKFEVVDFQDSDSQASPLADNHDSVDFEWNPATSELSYRAGTGASVFSDLVPPSAPGGRAPASCGSR
jgi:hypothetical protein